MWFKCRGCEARDQEIRHLLAELDRLHGFLETSQKRLTELADPGINARLTPRAPASRQVPIQMKTAVNFPGYERPRPQAQPEIEIKEMG